MYEKVIHVRGSENLVSNPSFGGSHGSIMTLYEVETMKPNGLWNIIRIIVLNPLKFIYYYGAKINILLVLY